MPFLLPCDGPAPPNGAGIRAMNTAITAAGTSPGSSGKRKIVVLRDDTINAAIGGVVVLLSPYTNLGGEHDTFDRPYTSVESSASHQLLVDGLGACTSLSHELDCHGTCAALSHELGNPGNCTHLPNPPH
jgi:hypothetical protein